MPPYNYRILTRDNHLDAGAIKGSYAGALGIPQFMPSSYRYYGVAYHKGDPVNLYNDNDAIASVANYFHKNGLSHNYKAMMEAIITVMKKQLAFIA